MSKTFIQAEKIRDFFKEKNTIQKRQYFIVLFENNNEFDDILDNKDFDIHWIKSGYKEQREKSLINKIFKKIKQTCRMKSNLGGIIFPKNVPSDVSFEEIKKKINVFLKKKGFPLFINIYQKNEESNLNFFEKIKLTNLHYEPQTIIYNFRYSHKQEQSFLNDYFYIMKLMHLNCSFFKCTFYNLMDLIKSFYLEMKKKYNISKYELTENLNHSVEEIIRKVKTILIKGFRIIESKKNHSEYFEDYIFNDRFQSQKYHEYNIQEIIYYNDPEYPYDFNPDYYIHMETEHAKMTYKCPTKIDNYAEFHIFHRFILIFKVLHSKYLQPSEMWLDNTIFIDLYNFIFNQSFEEIIFKI